MAYYGLSGTGPLGKQNGVRGFTSQYGQSPVFVVNIPQGNGVGGLVEYGDPKPGTTSRPPHAQQWGQTNHAYPAIFQNGSNGGTTKNHSNNTSFNASRDGSTNHANASSYNGSNGYNGYDPSYNPYGKH